MHPGDIGIGRLYYLTRDAVALADAVTGRVALFNPAAESLFGYSEMEARQLQLADLFAAPDKPKCATLFRDFVSGDHTVPGQTELPPLELLARRRDGAVVWVEADLSRLDEGPGRYYLLAVVRDITHRRQTEDLLRQAEARYRDIIENAVEGIYQTSPAGRLILANPALARICGYASPEDMLARLTNIERQVYVDPARRAEFVRLLEEFDAVSDFRSEIYRADGTTIWIGEHARGVRDGDGRLLYYEGTVQDISDRRRAETERANFIREQAARQAAERENRRFAFLAEAGGVLASSLDHEATLTSVARLAVASVADLCLIDIVEADGTLRRLAIAHADPAKDVLARGLQRTPPASNAVHPVNQVVRSGRPHLLKEVPDSLLQAIARDNEHLATLRALGAHSSIVVPLVAHGEIHGAISFLAGESGRVYGPDDLQLAEELARRAALAVENARLYREAQEAIALRNEFLSVAAHELKTPLTSLRGTAQLLLRRLTRGDDLAADALRPLMRRLDEQSGKLGRLIDQLLDTSRIEAGKLVLDCQAVDVVQLVAEMRRALLARDLPNPIHLNAPPAAQAWIDPLRFEQVLANLLDNALKFSQAGEPITIEIGQPDAENVHISVRDRGIGIPPEHRARVFERFHQAHAKDYGSGLGLGLYISRQIVDLHGGQIVADFPDDGGTIFTLTLPVRPPTA